MIKASLAPAKSVFLWDTELLVGSTIRGWDTIVYNKHYGNFELTNRSVGMIAIIPTKWLTSN